MNKFGTIYKIYDKRALHQPYAELPLLGKCNDFKKAKGEARDWGGVVVKETGKGNPGVVVYVHTPRRRQKTSADEITHKMLMGKLRRLETGWRPRGPPAAP